MVPLAGEAATDGADPERYDRTRPPYPDALVERIVAASPGPEVLDVGCGTGIEARQFQTAGCAVLGVEPDGRMAGVDQVLFSSIAARDLETEAGLLGDLKAAVDATA
jgi:SAM-dependent methyltransferase